MPWNPQTCYGAEYWHLSWCRRSCDLECNPANKEHDFEPYVHDYSCTGGCGNRCVERYEIKSAMASAKASASVAKSSGWGKWSSGESVKPGGWGAPAPDNVGGGGWGTLASGDSVDGSGRSGDQAQNVDGWGRSGDRDRPQEHEDQYRAVWQCNMTVLDLKEATIEGASYTNSAAESRSSSGARYYQSSAVCRGSTSNDQEVSANHFDIPAVPSSFESVARYSESAGPVSRLGAVDTPQPGSDQDAQASAKQKGDPMHWKLADLAVQCTDGLCQVNMGTIPVMLIEPACEDTDGMRCSFLAPNELKGSRRTAFVEEAMMQFRKQMKGKTTSKKWGHSDDAVRRFSAVMQEALDRVPEDERWEIGKNSHEDMAHAALVAYDFMIHLLPKFGQRPTRDDKFKLYLAGGARRRVGATSASAIVDSRANSVLISVPTAKRKGLLSKIDMSQKVTLSQAEEKKKIETYGVVRGGVSYQMISKHGRMITITLPCHVAAVN